MISVATCQQVDSNTTYEHSRSGTTSQFVSIKSDTSGTSTFPWWHSRHASARLDNKCKGLLVDIGAYDILMGDPWVERVTTHVERFGHEDN
eukprot:2844262-Prorocentrum_lima.AAC.1